MATCSFCGKEIEQGTGKIYVKIDGRVFHFCSGKCEKNQIVLGRKPRKTRWTNEYQEIKSNKK
jgi:large subunit ribosomal protein L24e